MTRNVEWLSISLFLTWTTLAAPSPQGNAPGQLFIQRDGERLTVDAREVPHQQLLEAMARWLGFELILTGSLPQPRSLAIAGRPWEQALKQVLSPANWAFRYARTAAGDRLVQVMVIPPEPRPEAERREALGPAASGRPALADTASAEVGSAGVPHQEEQPGREGSEAAGQDTQDAQDSPQQGSEEVPRE